MDDAIWALVEKGIVSPHEAFMKAIDKSRFEPFLSSEEEHSPTPPVPSATTKGARREIW